MQPSPNSEAIAVWNDVLVPKFTRFRHILVEGLEVHASAAFLRHAPAPGMLLLDIGCGFGESTIALARRVGPNGYVLGVDCCEAFLSVGRQDAIRTGVTNLRFEAGDAQVHRFRSGFDLAFSRFGTMFFQSPVAALLNVRRALKPGGRLVMLVWRRFEDNEWQALPRRLARAHLPAAAAAPSSAAFSMADHAGLAETLRAAGFVDPAFERVDRPVMVGRTVDEAVDFQLQLCAAGEAIREAGAEGEAKRPLIVADLQQALARYQTADGVAMPSSSWTVTARAVMVE